MKSGLCIKYHALQWCWLLKVWPRGSALHFSFILRCEVLQKQYLQLHWNRNSQWLEVIFWPGHQTVGQLKRNLWIQGHLKVNGPFIKKDEQNLNNYWLSSFSFLLKSTKRFWVWKIQVRCAGMCILLLNALELESMWKIKSRYNPGLSFLGQI